MKKTGLKQQITRFLKEQLKDTGIVSSVERYIRIRISREDFEHHLGNILQHLYRLIDQHFPQRQEDLSLLIGDHEGHYQNTFKLWRSTGAVL